MSFCCIHVCVSRFRYALGSWIDFIMELSLVDGRKEKENAYSEEDIITARRWANEANHIFLHTGAGMSVASGIGTFRGKYGLWSLYKRVFIRCLIGFIGLVILSFFLFNSYLVRFLVFFSGLCILVMVGILSFVLTGMVSTGIGWRSFPRLSWFVYGIFFLKSAQVAQLNDGHRSIMRFRDMNPKIKSINVHTSNVDGLEAKMGQDFISFNHGTIRHLICQTKKCRTLLELHDEDETSSKKKNEKLVYFKDISRIIPQYCRKCGKPMRPSCVFFMDGRGRSHRMGSKPVVGRSEKAIHFIIGSSGLIPLGVGSWKSRYPGKVIEINLMEPDNSLYYKHISSKRLREEEGSEDYVNDFEGDDYIWIQGKQEIVLPQILQVDDDDDDDI